MAVRLQFIDFLVPIATIRAKYPGGWENCLADHAGLVGGRVWYDEHLFRDGAMNPLDIRYLVDRWKALGFMPMAERDGGKCWEDVCVVESLLGGATLPCAWIEVDRELRIAYLRGTDPGPIVGRDSFFGASHNRAR